MREIEFRGKRINYFQPKEPPKWIYGPANCTERFAIMLVKEYNIWTDVERETVGQYTGLKDKHGVKIYEGDVLDVTACPDTRYIGVVVYNSHVASFEILFDEAEMGFPLQDDFEMEVVGNIFDDLEFEERFGKAYRSEVA